MTNLQDVSNSLLQNRAPVDAPNPPEVSAVLVPEVDPDEIVFELRELTNDTVRLIDVRSFEHHPRRREGNVVTQKCPPSSHLRCDRIKSRHFRDHHDPIDTLDH